MLQPYLFCALFFVDFFIQILPLWTFNIDDSKLTHIGRYTNKVDEIIFNYVNMQDISEKEKLSSMDYYKLKKNKITPQPEFVRGRLSELEN